MNSVYKTLFVDFIDVVQRFCRELLGGIIHKVLIVDGNSNRVLNIYNFDLGTGPSLLYLKYF